MSIKKMVFVLWLGMFSPMASATGVPAYDGAAFAQRVSQIKAMADQLTVMKAEVQELIRQTRLQNLELDAQVGLNSFFNESAGIYGGAIPLPPDITKALADIGIVLPKKCTTDSAWGANNEFEKRLNTAAEERYRINDLNESIHKRYGKIKLLSDLQTKALTTKQSADVANRLAMERISLANEQNELTAIELSFKARVREESLVTELSAWKESRTPITYKSAAPADVCY